MVGLSSVWSTCCSVGLIFGDYYLNFETNKLFGPANMEGKYASMARTRFRNGFPVSFQFLEGHSSREQYEVSCNISAFEDIARLCEGINFIYVQKCLREAK